MEMDSGSVPALEVAKLEVGDRGRCWGIKKNRGYARDGLNFRHFVVEELECLEKTSILPLFTGNSLTYYYYI